MTDHPDAHATNRSSRENIAAAKLVLAMDALNYGALFPTGGPDDDVMPVPMENWNEIVQARHSVCRMQRVPVVQAMVDAIDAINLGRQYHAGTRKVRLTIQQWSDLLTTRTAARRDTDILVAVASEYFNRHGYFPGQKPS